MCRTKAQDEAGYPGPLSLSSAIKEWARVHHWSLRVLANCTVYLSGGAEANLSSHNPRGIVVTIRPRDPNPSRVGKGNPATTFYLEDFRAVHMHESGQLSQQWDELRPTLRALEADLRRDGPGDALAGVMPAVFVMEASTTFLASHFKIYRTRADSGVDSMTMDPRTRAALMDLSSICRASVNAGLLFYTVPSTAQKAVPEMGQYMQSGRRQTWDFELLDFDWDAFVSRLYRSKLPSGLGLSPRDILRIYHDIQV